MNNDRITWTDVQRAADRLADVWQQIGGPRPAGVRLYVTPGSVTNGHAAELTWMTTNAADAAGVPIPGGQRLARSARDSYDMVTQRTAALLDVAAYITGRVQS